MLIGYKEWRIEIRHANLLRRQIINMSKSFIDSIVFTSKTAHGDCVYMWGYVPKNLTQPNVPLNIKSLGKMKRQKQKKTLMHGGMWTCATGENVMWIWHVTYSCVVPRTGALCNVQLRCVTYSCVVSPTVVLCHVKLCCVTYSCVVSRTGVLCHVEVCCVT